MRWIEGYLTIPYALHGRDRKGCDCWGLTRLVLAEQAGLVLPLHDTIAAAQFDAKIAEEAEQWLPVSREAARAFDVAVMSDGRGAEIHIGLVTAPGFILHTEEARGPMHQAMTHIHIRSRIRGLYRHRELA